MLSVPEVAQLLAGKIEGDASITIDTIRPVDSQKKRGTGDRFFSNRSLVCLRYQGGYTSRAGRYPKESSSN